jgi:hypothetical protein
LATSQEFDETCENCKDALRAYEPNKNWSIADVSANLQYCTKPECQQAKPILVKNQITGSIKKNRERDRGLPSKIKDSSRFTTVKPDQDKVDEFAKMFADPTMKTEKGLPKVSKMFPAYGIDTWEKGFMPNQVAVVNAPEEVDENGCPSKASVATVRRYFKSLTRRFDGNLELYSSKGRNAVTGRTERRWYVLRYEDDLRSQVGDMREISKNIELAAARRERNFKQRPYKDRMEKVDLLDRFFEE